MEKKLKRTLKALCIMCAIVFSLGCNNVVDTPGAQEPYKTPSDPARDVIQVPEIRINTVSTDENVMNFVTNTLSASVFADRLSSDDQDRIAEFNTYEYPNKNIPYPEVSNITVINEYGDKTLDNVSAEVKVRGNYTTGDAKKPLKIEFTEKKSMLGLHNGKKFKKWVLLACWKDMSFLRDTTAYDLNRLLGGNYYSSDSKIVEVYINNQYWGVYVLVEQQEAKRMGITNAEKNDGITDTGYIFELDTYGLVFDRYKNVCNSTVVTDKDGRTFDIEEDYFWAYDSNCYSFKSKCDEKKRNFLQNYLNKLLYICDEAKKGDFYKFNSSYTDIEPDSSVDNCRDCVSKIIDIQSFVNTYILSEVACDQDLNYSSFYLTVDFGPEGNRKLTLQAPWDFDSAFGHIKGWPGDLTMSNISYLFAKDSNGYEDTDRKIGNTWTMMFIEEPWFQKLICKKWDDVRRENVLGKLIGKIDSISNNEIYIEAFARDYDRWDDPTQYWRPQETLEFQNEITTQKESADILKNWLIYRFGNLDMHFDMNNPQSDFKK